MFVCLCACVNLFLFSSKKQSGSTDLSILNFGTNIWYDIEHCVRENKGYCLIGAGRGAYVTHKFRLCDGSHKN